jgi:MoaA/NifB/PqqE/SkfB family radical SAM enzyme
LKKDLFRAWGRILTGHPPSLSIEITRECPLRCPGCYAYEPDHLGDAGPLRSLADFRGQALVDNVLALVREHRPVHLSIVGGEPLVRFRELDRLLPILSDMGVIVQLVTSAVRPIPPSWNEIDGLTVVVSIDGLQPEHDRRRAPATYDRILSNIEGHSLVVHCTMTRQMAERTGSSEEFVSFWSSKREVSKIWFSFFTPQMGSDDAEIVPPRVKDEALEELRRLRARFPKLYMPDHIVRGYRNPPANPDDCIFARATACFSSDLETTVTPCQLGGNPDCGQCGCMASAGLKAIGDYRVLGALPLRTLFKGSERIGRAVRGAARRRPPAPDVETVEATD